MKSFYMELDAFDVVTNKKIGVLTASGKDREFEKVTMTIPENQGFYVDSHELIELARLVEETLDL